MKKSTLFIDETGVPDPNNLRQTYVLCGCAIREEDRSEIRDFANQIKYKYWGDTEIVLHSKEIGRNVGPFKVFANDEVKKKEFLKELLRLLNSSKIIVFVNITDKKEALKLKWDKIKIIKESSKNIFFDFIAFIFSSKPKIRGLITIESSDKDKYYLDQFKYFISPGQKMLKLNHKEIQGRLTSISFVTKHNNDIEEQICDLFSYAAQCKYKRDIEGEIYAVNGYEAKIIRILESKLFKIPSHLQNTNTVHFRQIDSFCLIPGLNNRNKKRSARTSTVSP